MSESQLSRGVARSRCFLPILLILVSLSVYGCSDAEHFFDRTGIDQHSKDLIGQMGNVEAVPDSNEPIDASYTGPPEIVNTSKGTFVFYNARYQPPEQLSALLKSTLGVTVSTNTKVNQCVIKCDSQEDAQLVVEFLAKMDKRPIQVEVDCLVSEVYADLTLDYETTMAIDDLFGTGDGTIRKVGDVLADAIKITGTLPGASNRDVSRANMGMDIGLSSASGSFNAMIDLLISRGYMQVVMRPRLKVVNGQTAKIQTSDSTPITKTVTTNNVDPYDITEYADVTDSLEITPTVYSDGSIGLQTKVVLGSTSTPQGVSQKTIITTREIDVAENLITPGSSLVIGGLRKTEKVGITRGVPFLMDIPFLGVLFSSKDYETSAKEILFILTPTIANMGEDHQKVIQMIRRKHAEKERGGLLGVMDSLCGDDKPQPEFDDAVDPNGLTEPKEPEAVDDPNEP